MNGDQRAASVARALQLVTLGCVAGVFVAYLACSLALLSYRWDWSPDEGLFLDYARRLVVAPGTLYPKQVTPYPESYGPVVPIVLAPFVPWSDRPLLWARLLNIGCVGLIAVTLAALVRPNADSRLAWGAAALALAPMDLSFWHMLVRADTPMLLGWLAAAVSLMPARIERGAERLSWGRALAGGACVVLSALSKPTGLLHAAPLVGVWLFVDRAGFLRLLAIVGLGALGSFGLLELLSGGGHAAALRLFGTHPYFPAQIPVILELFARLTWPILALAVAAFLDAWRRGAVPWRDGSIALICGGLLVVPALAKGGAYHNYLHPLLCGLIVASARWLGDSPRPKAPSRAVHRAAVDALPALLAAVLAATRVFPLPSPRNDTTAQFFYGFVRSAVAREGPIFALAPDYAYFVVGQPVEMESTSLRPFLIAGAPGISAVIERLSSGHYGLLILGPWGPPDTAAVQTLFARYEIVGECRLGSFLGGLPYRVAVRRGSSLTFDPPANIDCRAGGGS